MSDYLSNVAIIGAGLGGCALALSLSVHNVQVTIYESRPSDAEVLASGVVLTPNGLRVLDRIGVLRRLKDRCYIIAHRTFKNDNDETIRKTLITDESLYGYRNHRIWRKLLLDEMRQMLEERGVRVNYNSRFSGIVSDTTSGVNFLINDVKHDASLLVGSDGIYSTVRSHIAPDIVPQYTGIVGVLAHIKRASVAWPYEDYERNATIQGKPGAIFWIPEDPAAEVIMTGMQVQFPEQSREDLDKLQADKDRLVAFYRRNYEEWGPTARSIIDSVSRSKETCYIWPYMKMPKLEKWYSDSGRVICVADAAHAIPPSSGQGVNQALEDVWSLTLLLTSVRDFASADGAAGEGQNKSITEMDEALAFWQEMRQKRVDAVFDWATNSANVQRMPEVERKKLIAEGKIKGGKEGERDDMAWLYKPNLEEEVRHWIDGRA